METPGRPDCCQPTALLTRQQLLEQQLEDVQRIAHVGTWKWMLASNKLICSEQACRIAGVGQRRDDANFDTYLAAVHPDDRPAVLASIEQARHAPLRAALEHRLVRPDGSVRYLQVRGERFRDEHGDVGIAGTVQDITAKTHPGAARRAKSRRLYDVLESMSVAFYTLDNAWRFTYLNAEAERLLQHPRAELLGRNVWQAFPQAQGSRFESEYRQAMQLNQPRTFEELYVPFNTWTEVRIFPSTTGLAVYCTDISERKQLQKTESENAERFRIVANTTTDIIWDWDPVRDHVWWSEGIHSVFGYDLDQFDTGSKGWSGRIHPDDRARVVAGISTVLRSAQPDWSDEYRFLRRDGSYADVRDRGTFIRNRDGVATRVIGAMVDVTEQKRAEADRASAEAHNRVQASLLDKAQDAISVTGVDARVTYWNKGAERLFGWSADEAVGKTKAELGIVEQQEFDTAYPVLLQQGDWSGEIVKRRKDGSSLTVESHLTLVRDDAGQPQSVLYIQTDITQRKQAEQEIKDLAFFDPLTGLPNRRLLLDRLRHAVASCRRNRRTGALLFIDLDSFKSLNDTLGHDQGDVLLRQVALRLRASVPRASDTVARHGGDEFVIVLEDLSIEAGQIAHQAELVAEKIQAGFEAPFALDHQQHHTSASIGVALFNEHTDDVDALLKRADLAMYQAKTAGRNTIRFFDPQMQTVINTRAQLEADLRQGLQRHEFRVHYQRQTDGNGHTTGAEALVRWQHPHRRLMLPAMFIPLAEETGLILPLGQWVLETACLQLVAWARVAATAHLTVAVNVSACQLRQSNFVEQVLQVIERTGADPNKLTLEVTESLLAADVERTAEKMNCLKARGIRFALDDFGTGYSSLSYLKRLPLNQLKIDQSFVRDVLTDPSDAAIARTVLALGHTLGLEVIAEGVETACQRDFLALIGCRAYQGYLFSHPVPAEQF